MTFRHTLTRATSLASLVLLATLFAFAPQARAQTAFSNFTENKLIDWMFRGQAIGITGASAAAGTGPTTLYVALATGACADTGLTGEVSGSNYSRASVASSMANWAGTQGAGTTAASTGTGVGVTSNNAAITFATPSATWGTVASWALFDAVSAGNMLLCATLTASKTINSGDTVSFAAGALTVTFD